MKYKVKIVTALTIGALEIEINRCIEELVGCKIINVTHQQYTNNFGLLLFNALILYEVQ
jgi:uncharacterized heparinase superfamily protein